MLFIPLFLVVVLALLKLPPFTTIFIGALAGGVLAVAIAPERVIAYANAEGLPRGLGLLKGVWLALGDGYVSSTGDAAIDRSDLARRHGEHARHGLADHHRPGVRRRGREGRRARPPDRPADRRGAVRRRVGRDLVGAVFATNVLAADQYIAIVLPGRMFSSAFESAASRRSCCRAPSAIAAP